MLQNRWAHYHASTPKREYAGRFLSGQMRQLAALLPTFLSSAHPSLKRLGEQNEAVMRRIYTARFKDTTWIRPL